MIDYKSTVKIPEESEQMLREMFSPMNLPRDLRGCVRSQPFGGSMFRHRFYVQVMYNKSFNRQIVKCIRYKEGLAKEYLLQKKFDEYVFLHERPYRLHALLEVFDKLKPATASCLVRSVWVDSEFPSVNIEIWNTLFRKIDVTKAMSRPEKTLVRNLSDNVSVFRGVSSKTKRFVPERAVGLSWTLDKEKAKWFACRFGGDPHLLSATIPKESVRMVILSRGESEVIVTDKIQFTAERIADDE
jgi:hypothetical protein